jgi:hypothetical protein
MKRKGVIYDVGTVYAGRLNTRPVFDAAVTRRELEIIKDDLHCNAVRIRGQDLGRLMTAAEVLRRRFPGWLVVSVGSEATLFVKGIVAGRTITKRLATLFRDAPRRHERPQAARRLPGTGAPCRPPGIPRAGDLRVAAVRAGGLEPVRPRRCGPLPACARQGPLCRAAQAVLRPRQAGRGHRVRHAHLRRRRQLGSSYVRKEALQARELTETLGILDATGVDRAFVTSFSEPMATFSDGPRYDLDMSALSLVKTHADRHGTTYPDLPWEPKQSFLAVADFYGRAEPTGASWPSSMLVLEERGNRRLVRGPPRSHRGSESSTRAA